MNKPLESKITDMKEGYASGVWKYRQMGYWEPDSVPERHRNPGDIALDATGPCRFEGACCGRHRRGLHLDLFEAGSIANLTASIIGNVFSFNPLAA